MDKRLKLSKALNHMDGPIPFDLGGTRCTGIHISMVEKLREYYGLERKPVRLLDPFQMLGVVDDDLKEIIGVDTASVLNPNTQFGFKDEGEKEWKTPWGQTILVQKDFNTTEDERNIYIYAEGDLSYPPAGCMPKTGFYFDNITRGHSYDEDNPHVEDNLEEFRLLSDEDLERIKKETEEAYDKGYGVVASFGGTDLGDVSMVPGSGLKEPKGLRDLTEWYIALVADPEYIGEIFNRQTDIALENLKRINQVVGDKVQVAMTCGTDFGAQNGAFCSPDTFRSLYLPYYKKINGWIHENTNWKIFKHSCGSIMELLPLIIEAGFDIINPVQWTAGNMDPIILKERFGNDIVFWGGGVNTQKTFPYGTPDQVREEVLRACEIFGKNGGYVFHTIHNIQALTPIENAVSLINAFHEYNS